MHSSSREACEPRRHTLALARQFQRSHDLCYHHEWRPPPAFHIGSDGEMNQSPMTYSHDMNVSRTAHDASIPRRVTRTAATVGSCHPRRPPRP